MLATPTGTPPNNKNNDLAARWVENHSLIFQEIIRPYTHRFRHQSLPRESIRRSELCETPPLQISSGNICRLNGSSRAGNGRKGK